MPPTTPPKAAHTPTPLIDLYHTGEPGRPWQFLVERLGISQRRAEEIIRAVNAHEELLEACIMMLNICRGQKVDFPSMRFVENTVAKAEGKE